MIINICCKRGQSEISDHFQSGLLAFGHELFDKGVGAVIHLSNALGGFHTVVHLVLERLDDSEEPTLDFHEVCLLVELGEGRLDCLR